MKTFIVLAAVVACASAGVVYNGLNGYALAGAPIAHQIVSAPITYSAVVAPAVTKTQYHSQDELGQASYGHAEPGQAHAAVRDAFGNVAGSYAYINPEGKEIRVEYIADAGGFRVASNALPIAPTAPPAPVPVALVAPVPVQDTPEVRQAKEAHAKAIADAQVRNAEAEKADAAKPAEIVCRRKRGVVVAASLAIAPVAYSAYAHPIAVANVREATLTRVHNNLGHAVSYRVD